MPDKNPVSANPRDYVTEEEVRALYAPRPARVALDLACDWLLILGSIAAWGATKHPLVLVLAFLVIGARQHALNNWVHEASHFSLTRNRKRNDLVSDIFAATPHLITTAGYRAKHMLHHSHLGHPEKDDEFKSRYLLSGSHFFSRVGMTLLGTAAVATLKTYTGLKPTPAPQQDSQLVRFLALAGISNALILGWCWLWGVPFAWLYLWVLPLITVTSLLATLRVVAEHQSEEYALAGQEQFDEQLSPAITRTIDTDFLTSFFLAPVKFNYHYEHHVWPAVPYTSLPALSELLRERGFYKANPDLYGSSYYAVLSRLIWPKPRADMRPNHKDDPQI